MGTVNRLTARECCVYLVSVALLFLPSPLLVSLVFVLEKGQVQYMASMATTVLTLLFLLPAIILAKPQYRSSGIPANVLDGLPSQNFYQPEKSPNIPILPGERRCDNYYNGEVMPCLMRPWLPPFSYSTTEGNNGEYKRKRRSARTWRAV